MGSAGDAKGAVKKRGWSCGYKRDDDDDDDSGGGGGDNDDRRRCKRGSGLRSYQRELLLWRVKERSIWLSWMIIMDKNG